MEKAWNSLSSSLGKGSDTLFNTVENNTDLTYIWDTFTNKPEWIAYFLLLLTLIGISIYVYYYFVEPKLEPSFSTNRIADDKDISSSVKADKRVYLYLYKVDWCPHCCKLLGDDSTFKTFFKDELSDYIWGDDRIQATTEIYNPETESHDVTINNSIKQYKPDGYPTVVLFIGDDNDDKYKAIELDAKINKESILKFLKEKLGPLNTESS